MPKVVDVEERRQELTDAAARLIARAGIGAATMREVAAEAGLTTGALTHYFADKRELLQCTLRASLQRRIDRRRGTDGDPGARLRASLVGALPLDDEARRHWMVTVAFCAEAAGDRALALTQRDAYREFRTHITRLVSECLPGDDPGRLAERLIAAVDGVALQALFDPESWPPVRQLDALDEALGRLVPAAACDPQS
jgi:TetR/AcrR family transcriptional regulator, transcriptional repressor of bet genes